MQVKRFFQQSSRADFSVGKKRKRDRFRNRGENFADELMDFKKFSNDVKEKEKR